MRNIYFFFISPPAALRWSKEIPFGPLNVCFSRATCHAYASAIYYVLLSGGRRSAVKLSVRAKNHRRAFSPRISSLRNPVNGYLNPPDHQHSRTPRYRVPQERKLYPSPTHAKTVDCLRVSGCPAHRPRTAEPNKSVSGPRAAVAGAALNSQIIHFG